MSHTMFNPSSTALRDQPGPRASPPCIFMYGDGILSFIKLYVKLKTGCQSQKSLNDKLTFKSQRDGRERKTIRSMMTYTKIGSHTDIIISEI